MKRPPASTKVLEALRAAETELVAAILRAELVTTDDEEAEAASYVRGQISIASFLLDEAEGHADLMDEEY